METTKNTILYSVGFNKKGDTQTIIETKLWGHERHRAREIAKALCQEHKCDILITYTPKVILETVPYINEETTQQ